MAGFIDFSIDKRAGDIAAGASGGGGAVDSVNGLTGAIVLDGSNINLNGGGTLQSLVVYFDSAANPDRVLVNGAVLSSEIIGYTGSSQSTVYSEINGVKADVTTLQTDVTTLQTDYTALEARVAALEAVKGGKSKRHTDGQTLED